MIHRIRKTSQFCQIPNLLARDKRLSYKARGILLYVLSQTDNWHTSKQWLEEGGTEGREAIASAIKELVRFGYLKIEEPPPHAGQFLPHIWYWTDSALEVCEDPSTDDRQRETVNGKSRTQNTIEKTVGENQEGGSGNGSNETAAQEGIATLFQDMASEKLDPKNQPPPEPPKVETPPPKAPRQRNVLADTLATMGCEKLEEVTKPQWSAIMVALKSIKEVCPNVTPDEIKRRAGRYRINHPTWELTPLALAKHWASLSDSVKKPVAPKTGIPNIHTYKPPTNG